MTPAAPRVLRSKALVSVCITSYNYGRYLRDAIESALTQSYPNIEVVVSDNASTDDTFDVLAAYAQDSRVRVFRNETNVGLCRNHNLAIMRSTGDYIVVLSADDVLLPGHVDRLMRRMLDPLDPVLITFGQGVLLTESLEVIRPIFACGNLPIAFSHRDDFGNLLFNYHHMYPARLIARSVYEAYGLFDERMMGGIDIEICARFEAEDVPAAFVPEFVAGFREHGTRTSAKLMDTTDELFNDKLYMYELALDPKNAWRIEGYESLILAVADMELQRLARQGSDALFGRQAERMLKLRESFAALERQTPEWPLREPQLSIIVLSEGYPALLNITLDALKLQQVERVEFVVVQTAGCDLGPLLAHLPYADRIRIIQAGACANPAYAYRYGLELARGEYVTYLSEGQRVAPDIYAGAIQYARGTNSQMVLLPKPIIDDAYPAAMPREYHLQQFADPATRAAARLASDEYSFCQLVHRRGMVRGGSMLRESMVNAREHDYIVSLAAQFTTVTLSLAAT